MNSKLSVHVHNDLIHVLALTANVYHQHILKQIYKASTNKTKLTLQSEIQVFRIVTQLNLQ